MASAHETTPLAVEKPAYPPAEPGAADAESVPKTIITLDSKGEHLLQSTWTFWFARKIPKTHPAAVNYAEHLQKIASFNTVEEFYRTYVYIARPLELPKDSNFHMFKGDVVPMWESFPNGGCWIIKINKKSPQLSLLWEELVMYSIGETLEEPDIVGVVLSVRSKEFILAIWNADSQNPTLRTRVCEKLKYFLRLDPATPIEYKPNSTSMRDKSTYRNGKIVAPRKDKKKKKKGSKQPTATPASDAAAPASTPAPTATATATATATPTPTLTTVPTPTATANGKEVPASA